MPPLVRAALFSALFAALSVATDRPQRAVRVGSPARPGASASELAALCPRGTLPDGEVCVPVPPRDALTRGAASAAREPRSRFETPDRIERRPERPADYARYRLPIDLPKGSAPSGSRLPAQQGALVRLVRLEHQEGDAEVLHAGPLPGERGVAIVTLHSVREAGGLREYLAVHGSLARLTPGLARGSVARDGDPLGAVGDADGAANAGFDYAIRRVRTGSVARSLALGELIEDGRSVPCDARNVLPLR